MQKVRDKYRVQYRDSLGKMKSATFDKKQDALDFEEKVRRERQLISQGLELPRKSELVLDYAGAYLRKRFQRKKHSTAIAEERKIKLFVEHLGIKPIRGVTTKDIRDLLDKIQDELKWSNSTRNRMRAYLHIMFQQAFEDELIMFNPVSRIPLEEENPKRKIPLTAEEAEKFIAASDTPMRRLFATILVYQGPRVSEAVALQHGDIDLKNGVIHFRRIAEQSSGTVQERIKGSLEGIIVPLLPIVRLAYVDYLATLKGVSSGMPLFIRPNGEMANVYTGKSWVRTLTRYAEIKRKVTPHVLRATFASLAEENGMPGEVIQKMMGHSTILMTERYIKRRVEELKNRIEEVGFGAVLGPNNVIELKKEQA